MRYCIAIDLGGTNIRGTWIDENRTHGEIILQRRHKDLDGTKHDIKSLISKIIQEKNKLPIKIGIASAGPLDYKKKKYLNPINMPELKDFQIGDYIYKTFNVPCILENDAQAAALGEIDYGSLKGKANGITITLGTGVGTGVVMDKKIWRGNHITGPELGHLYLGGEKVCGCGQIGCAETMLNKLALLDLCKKYKVDIADPRELDLMAKSNRDPIIPILEEYGFLLGLFICDLQVIFCIDYFCISGGLSKIAKLAKKYIWQAINNRFKKQKMWMPKEIVFSLDPNKSALFGIARLCFER